MSPTPVEKLVAAAQRGDQKAFSEIVTRFYSMVHGLALSKVGNWTAAGDVTQEAFLLAWSNLHGLKQPEAFPVWVRRIARNTAFDWLRREQFRGRLSASFARRSQETPTTPDNPAAATARQECLEQIGEALRPLSPKLREALVLYYLEGNTVAESAQALGIREDTMRKRLQLGCEQMRTHYERQQTPTLQQHLPYSPQPYAQRIMAGIAAGPTAVTLRRPLSHSRFGMMVHHLNHGGSWTALREARIVAPILKTACAGLAALAVICGGAVGIVSYAASDPAATTFSSADARNETKLLGCICIEHWDDPRLGNFIFIPYVYEDTPAYAAGLRPGDRIIKANGRPIQRGYRDTSGFRVPTPKGPLTRLTILRPGPSATEQELIIEVLWPK